VSSTTTRSISSRRSSDALGVEPPEAIGGHAQSHFDGVSMRYSFDAAPLPSARATQFYSMLGSRSIWHDGYKAVTTHPTLSGWSQSERTPGSSTTSTSTAPSCTTSPRPSPSACRS